MEIEKSTGRIAENLEHLKRFTATPGNGCTRLPFTKEAREAADYLKEIMADAGLEVWEDAAGNLFGRIRGTAADAPCVMSGSHYDSVVNGGDFDGIGGVICSLEAARLLQESGKTFKRDFVVVAFCDEEGMRFGTGYFGSGAMLGHRDAAYTRKFKDANGISIAEAMQAYGLDPEKVADAKWPDGSIGHMIEAHIEQGPVLDAEKKDIGLVTGIVGIQRYMVTVYGRADHAGTTPMDMRIDAVEAATKVISKIPDWAREKADGTVATVGVIHVLPSGMNIVAESCEFSVDIRSMNNDNINDITRRIRAALDREAAAIGGRYEMDTKLMIEPVAMSVPMLKVMEDRCKAEDYDYKYLPSGAGHDSLEIGQQLPTAMVFVPSKDGRSHTPVEFSKYSDLARATDLIVALAEKLLDE
jgi:allantoate deiminase